MDPVEKLVVLFVQWVPHLTTVLETGADTAFVERWLLDDEGKQNHIALSAGRTPSRVFRISTIWRFTLRYVVASASSPAEELTARPAASPRGLLPLKARSVHPGMRHRRLVSFRQREAQRPAPNSPVEDEDGDNGARRIETPKSGTPFNL